MVIRRQYPLGVRIHAGVVALVDHLRRAGVEGRRRIFSGNGHKVACRQADPADLMREVGVAGEIVRIVVKGNKGKPLRVHGKLEKVAQIAGTGVFFEPI